MAEKENIDPSKIDGAPAEASLGNSSPGTSEVPGASNGISEKEREMLAHDARKFRAELGWLGRPFGGKREKPGNIAALVIILIFLVLSGAYATQTYVSVQYPDTKGVPLDFERLLNVSTSIVTLILGYLFGSNNKSDGE